NLLVATSGGVFGIDKNNKVTQYNNDIVYVLKKSNFYSNLLFTGKESGLSFVLFNKNWKEEDVKNINTQVRSIEEESEQNLWAGTYVSGAINFIYELSHEFKVMNSSANQYSYDKGLNGYEVDVFTYNNELVFSTDMGLMKKINKN